MNKLPVDFLEFLKQINSTNNINIEDVKLYTNINNENIITTIIFFNNTQIKFDLSVSEYGQVASLYYFKYNEASEIVKKIIFDNIIDYYEYVYKRWVYNHTGFNISSEFNNLIIKEIERIQNLWN